MFTEVSLEDLRGSNNDVFTTAKVMYEGVKQSVAIVRSSASSCRHYLVSNTTFGDATFYAITSSSTYNSQRSTSMEFRDRYSYIRLFGNVDGVIEYFGSRGMTLSFGDESIRQLKPLMHKEYESSVVFSGVQSYHYHKDKTMPRYIGRKPAAPYMVGVELETGFSGINKLCKRSRFATPVSNYYYIETDCSVDSSGVASAEVITIPLQPRHAHDVSFWTPLCERLDECGASSWRNSTTGMHVHISRTILGDDSKAQGEATGRLLYLYNYVIGAEMRRKVFGRMNGQWAKSLNDEKADAAKVLHGALSLKSVRDEVEKNLKSKSSGDRYFAINLNNSNTIEFRQGKGSINAMRLAAVVEFCEMCCKYAVATRIHRMSEAGFIKYCKTNCNAKGSLLGYISGEE